MANGEITRDGHCSPTRPLRKLKRGLTADIQATLIDRTSQVDSARSLPCVPLSRIAKPYGFGDYKQIVPVESVK